MSDVLQDSNQTLDVGSPKGVLPSRGPELVRSKTSAQRQAVELGYSCEQELKNQLAATLKGTDRQFGSLQIALEFSHPSGRTDISAQSSEGELITFETKLLNWRGAMEQAYRNSSFAHYSYVVLPAAAAKRAATDEFVKRKIGLCSVEGGRVTIELEAPRQNPLRPWITELALSVFTDLALYGGASSRSTCC
jgi:hypothetical protein